MANPKGWQCQGAAQGSKLAPAGTDPHPTLAWVGMGIIPAGEAPWIPPIPFQEGRKDGKMEGWIPPHPKEEWKLLQPLPGQPGAHQPVGCDLFQSYSYSILHPHQLIPFN